MHDAALLTFVYC